MTNEQADKIIALLSENNALCPALTKAIRSDPHAMATEHNSILIPFALQPQEAQ